jgi:hypothetical protein
LHCSNEEDDFEAEDMEVGGDNSEEELDWDNQPFAD